jgi:peptidoglycan-associated lipoprotein
MRGRTLVAPMTVLALFVAGCAKQPATMSASAPSPTVGVTAPSPAPTPSITGKPSTSEAAPRRAGGDAARPSPRPEPREFSAVADLPDIHFAFDRYDLRPDAQRLLLAHAVWLRSNTRDVVLIEGHCDERGTSEYNLALGERRAKAAMSYLVSRGVDARRITIVSHGEHRPQCRDRTEACWAKNRRAHFLVKRG